MAVPVWNNAALTVIVIGACQVCLLMFVCSTVQATKGAALVAKILISESVPRRAQITE